MSNLFEMQLPLVIVPPLEEGGYEAMLARCDPVALVDRPCGLLFPYAPLRIQPGPEFCRTTDIDKVFE